MSEGDQAHEELLRELAAAYDVATDYWDWQGRHVAVAADTMVAVLRALDVDASTVEAARAALAAQGRRGVAADAAAGAGDPAGLAADVRGARARRLGRRRLGRAGDRRAPRRRRAAGELEPAPHRRAELVGEATFAVPGDLPLGLPLGARAVRRPARADEPGRHAALGRHARPGSATSRAGGWPPSSTACARPARGAPAT